MFSSTGGFRKRTQAELEELQNEPTVGAINKLLKNNLWRRCKFITDFEMAETLSLLAVDLLKLEGLLPPKGKETLTQKLEREVCYFCVSCS